MGFSELRALEEALRALDKAREAVSAIVSQLSETALASHDDEEAQASLSEDLGNPPDAKITLEAFRAHMFAYAKEHGTDAAKELITNAAGERCKLDDVEPERYAQIIGVAK